MAAGQVSFFLARAPTIVAWIAMPGSGVPADTTVTVQAKVSFFGDGSGETVTPRFWDLDGDVAIGEPALLGDPEGDGIWHGTIVAPAGAEELRLIAEDSGGDTTSTLHFLVP
jgi:hypothetical protein